MARTHILKVENEYFDDLVANKKPFEVRKDDRGFQKGDTLHLCRYGREKHRTSSRLGYMNKHGDVVSSRPKSDEVDQCMRKITYVLTGGQLGIEPGYVVLGLALI